LGAQGTENNNAVRDAAGVPGKPGSKSGPSAKPSGSSEPNITDQRLDKAAAALERIAGLQQDSASGVRQAAS